MIIVDNSGKSLAARRIGKGVPGTAVRILENARNVGFGRAVNRGVRESSSPFVAVLNDDAAADPTWLDALLRAIERRPDAGMCAPQVRLFGEHRLDSAGMLLSADGIGKQRGSGRPPEDFPVAEEALFPSGSAALYRRAMLDDIGGFDEEFFLYCEDTDLGLRARWAGWKCLYVPGAIVQHHYSHSAGSASPVKAYYVERNRLFVIAKNFPVGMLMAAPFVSVGRYLWHLWYILGGKGSAARFRAEGHGGARLIWYILRAHAALAAHAGRLWRQRRDIRARARITTKVFRHLARSYCIRARRVAAQ